MIKVRILAVLAVVVCCCLTSVANAFAYETVH
jgi:hypothetical protein